MKTMNLGEFMMMAKQLGICPKTVSDRQDTQVFNAANSRNRSDERVQSLAKLGLISRKKCNFLENII
jgi:hypothetical protein